MGHADVRTHASRVLAVLALLVGMLAMHALASSHHALAASPAVTDLADLDRSAGSHAGGHEPEAPATTGAVTASRAPADVNHTALALCLAILTGVTAALVRRPAVAGGLLLAARPALRSRPAHHRRPRPPDPVADLCVSRT